MIYIQYIGGPNDGVREVKDKSQWGHGDTIRVPEMLRVEDAWKGGPSFRTHDYTLIQINRNLLVAVLSEMMYEREF